MKNETEIRARISELAIEMEKIHTARKQIDFVQERSLGKAAERRSVSYHLEYKSQREKFTEIEHLCWVLDEPIPERILEMLTRTTKREAKIS